MIIVEICKTTNPHYAMPARVKHSREKLFEWQQEHPNCKFDESENSRYILFHDEKDYVYFVLAYPYYQQRVEISPSSNG
jgi:hypothetical protein